MALGRKAYFITIAEVGNITKAAKLLHVSQPSLSQYIINLENEIGTKLFNRHSSPWTLTDAGKVYLEYVKELCGAEERYQNNIQKIRNEKDSTVTLGLPSQLILSFFNKYLLSFIIQNEDVNLVVKGGTSSNIERMLINGEVDIAFFYSPVKDDGRFIQKIVRIEEFFWACNINSELYSMICSKQNESLFLRDVDTSVIKKMSYLSVGEEYYFYGTIKDYVKKLDFRPARYIQVPSIQAILEYISQPQNNGISVLPDLSLKNWKKNKSIRCFRFEDVRSIWYLTLNYADDTELTGAKYRFWTYMLDYLNNVVDYKEGKM